MSRPEVQFWSLLRDHVPGDRERIENLVANGTPDVSGAFNGHDYWIELKVCKNIRKVKCPARLCQEDQLVWHTLRGRQGSLIFVIVKYDCSIIIYKWKKHELYEELGRAPCYGHGYDWDMFEAVFLRELGRHRCP